MNAEQERLERLAKLKTLGEQVRIGGKALSELFPSVINQLETAKMRLSKMNEAAGADGKENDAAQNDDDDDVPDLVGDFDEKSRLE
ncbi:unnamed protein product [Dibothriocephalus latus]|uniref:Uncharacterized protein n=1 Tax=Dibothriocephalus latus TaxID=60516 RepID=A0A3P7QDY3_DIBLA|nr:unnamed protein product [Dibothriocephalus latus]